MLVYLGFRRDHEFYNINARIKYLQGYYEDYTADDIRPYIEDYSVEELIREKWLLTVEYAIAYFLVAAFAIRFLLVPYQRMIKVLAILYLGLIAISAATYGFGYVVGDAKLGYRISRVFMGFLQSPIPLLILIPTHYIGRRESQA